MVKTGTIWSAANEGERLGKRLTVIANQLKAIGKTPLKVAETMDTKVNLRKFWEEALKARAAISTIEDMIEATKLARRNEKKWIKEVKVKSKAERLEKKLKSISEGEKKAYAEAKSKGLELKEKAAASKKKQEGDDGDDAETRKWSRAMEQDRKVRFHHVTKNGVDVKRTYTIAYRPDTNKKTGAQELRYGAVVFMHEPDDFYNRRTSNLHAYARLQAAPMRIRVAPRDPHFLRQLEKAVRRNGTHAGAPHVRRAAQIAASIAISS